MFAITLENREKSFTTAGMTRTFTHDRPLRIGTRGSKLALAQTGLFIQALTKKHPDITCETVVIVTTGDRIQDRALADAGGKGLFTKEIEEALTAGDIDCAVHSMKDMPTELPAGLSIPCILPREDVRDAFFSRGGYTIDTLPPGSVVGTASLRRQSIVLSLRPDLIVTVFRGNVDTRLQKLADGVVDATLLAVAGLNRLGAADKIQSILEPHVMLPAVAQGAVGIEIRQDDGDVAKLIDAVHCPITDLRITAERAFLREMDGSCRTPLAALMSEPDPSGRCRFDALVASTDGRDVKRVSYVMNVHHKGDAERLGIQAGRDLKAQISG
jgi:hydroxymethylbilane synthase